MPGYPTTIALALAIAASTAHAQSIRQVPMPPGATVLIGFDAFNGGGAVGTAASPTGGFQGLISRPGGNTLVPPPAGTNGLFIQSASATGSVMAGSPSFGFAVRYTAATGATSIGGLPGHTSSEALRISSDGTTIVGSSTNSSVVNSQTAYRWTSAGMVGLGRLPGTVTSSAHAVSADGSVVVGDSGNQAFRWTQAGGMQALTAPGASLKLARAVSGDGNTVWA